jgi:hypothetical protein
MTMRILLVLAAICFSANAFAQDASPKVGNKPLVQMKPRLAWVQVRWDGQRHQTVGW